MQFYTIPLDDSFHIGDFLWRILPLGIIALKVWFVVALIRMFGRIGKKNVSKNEIEQSLKRIEEDVRTIRERLEK